VMTVILMTHWTMASTQTLAHTPSVSAGMRNILILLYSLMESGLTSACLPSLTEGSNRLLF